MAMEPLRIYTMGGLRILQDGVPVTGLETRKAEALLVYLACNPRPHQREVLADLLWDERSQQQAMANLRGVLTGLRKQLDPYLTITRETVALNPDADVWTDASEIEASLDALRKQGAILSTDDAKRVEQALDNYKGEFLEGFFLRESQGFDEWMVRERERLDRLVVDGLHALVEFDLQLGSYPAGIAHATRLLALDPLDELSHQQMMQLLSFSGKRSEALAQYETCRRLLVDELGVEPSGATQVLYEKIRSAELARSRPPLKTIRGYELEEQIGAGSYGAVYCAVQKVVGREVAVKVILPQYANDPEFIRRFETEAQVVARLEHPHIVPLYDYWREPDGAYLVMRLLKGGNLETLLEAGRLETSRVMDLVDQIAAGLASAHAQGVIHRDLKPANILLDEAGNAYLSDFGIAKVLGENGRHTLTGQIIGTPFCLSPEQIRSEPVTPRSDLYSFGILLYQLLTGKMPFPNQTLAGLVEKHLYQPLPSIWASRSELPAEVDQVIQRATAKDPNARFGDALALAAACRAALTGVLIPALFEAELGDGVTVELVNPYKGLRAFQEADAADFFGREALTERLVARLDETSEVARFLAVVGPSGSGKSSLVRAGLVPALRRGALPGSEKWFIVEMVPGGHPFEELEIGLLHISTQPMAGLMEQLQRDERGILRAARLALPLEESELLLVIDQFEEVFTQIKDKAEASRFLNGLYEAVMDKHSRVRVVITLRADFFDRPLMQPDFSKLVQERTEVVVPLSVEELGRAVRSPAERVGVTLEPGLATAIVAEVVEQPGALPLLQYALTELFEQQVDHRLTLESYQAIGGVQGVLERRAEEIYAGLNPTGQAAARQIFLRLVTLGEGVEDTRRRVLRSELEAVGINPSALGGEPALPTGENSIDEVIEAFGEARLLSFDRDPLTRSPTVEIAHEALLREWGRLHGWLDESRADVRTQRGLGNAAVEWVKGGRDPSFLLHGARLSQFESWSEQTDLALTAEEQALLNASLAEREAQQTAEKARREREEALERRSRNFLRTLVVVLLLATVSALVLAGVARRAQTVAETETGARATAEAVALDEREAAQGQARQATAHELALASNLELLIDPERSILLALQSLRTTYTPVGEEALRQGVQASRLKLTITGHHNVVNSLEYSPDDTQLATGSRDGTVKIWDTVTGKEILSFNVGSPSEVAFSPDGQQLAAGLDDGRILIWDARSGESLLSFKGHTSVFNAIVFSPDGKQLASANMDDTIRVWDSSTGDLLYTLDAPSGSFGSGNYLAFVSEGKFLLISDIDGNNRLIDSTTGREIRKLLPDLPLRLFAVSSDNSFLVTGTDLWDLNALLAGQATKPMYSVGGPQDDVIISVFSQDGTRLATGRQDSTIKVWAITPEDGQELMTLAGPNGFILDLCFSPDGTSLASASFDGSIKVWDVTPEGSRELLTLGGHEDWVRQGVFSPVDDRLATAGMDGTVRIWSGKTGELLHTLINPKGFVFDLAFHPNGNQLATAGEDNKIRVWDTKTGQVLLTLIGHEDSQGEVEDYKVGGIFPGVTAVDYSPDGRLIASTGEDGTARIWDARSGVLYKTLTIHPNRYGGTNLAFSPDGTRFATATDQRGPLKDEGDVLVTIWDAKTWQSQITLSGFPTRVWGLAFSPDGRHLATSGASFVDIWDASTGQMLSSLPGHTGTVVSVAYSPDGSRLITAGDDLPKVWDLASRQALFSLPGHTGLVSGAAFNSDGTRLVTASMDGTARVYTMDLDELISLALDRLTRWFTPDECRQYLHLETCPPR